MSDMSRVVLVVLAIACLQASARPIKRTVNFNMFVLHPKRGSTDRLLLTTDGVSRFGPLLEYLVQRVQGMMSVRLPQVNPEPPVNVIPELPAVLQGAEIPLPDTSENEVDFTESRNSDVIVRPSQTKPGTYEVQINVVVDDGQPDDNRRDGKL